MLRILSVAPLLIWGVMPVLLWSLAHLPAIMGSQQSTPSPLVATEVLNAVNQYRQLHDWPALQLSPTLQKVAQAHAEDLNARNTISHQGADKSGLEQRLDRSRFRYTEAAENVDRAGTAKILISAWATKKAYADNVLGSYRAAGVGVSGSVVVMVFANGEEPQLAEPSTPITQRRIFSATSDGRAVGSYTQNIETSGDTVRLTCSASADVKVLLVRYHYDYNSTEVWKKVDGAWQLQGLSDVCHENGALRRNTYDGKTFTSNGAAAAPDASVWTTSYWALPPTDRVGQPIPLLDLSTGRYIMAQFRFVDHDAYGDHWRVQGDGLAAELWYDAEGRLCRRVMARQGRTATATLVRIE